MAIALNNTEVSARTLRRGEDRFTLAAGEVLEIEATDKLLETEVPVGKTWLVSIIVNIVETDA